MSNPLRCGPCDESEDAVPKALPAAVPESSPEASFEAFQDELSNVKPKTYAKDGTCVKDGECAGWASGGNAASCCSLHAHRTLACGIPLPEGGASIGWRCDPASLDEDMSGDDNEDALASTVEETVEETSACVPDGDCLANPVTPKLPEYYYCCSKTGHWTERCNSKARCGAADAEDSQYAFALEMDNGRSVDANPTSALNSSVTCTATNKCELRGASCCDHSDHGTAACSRTWCETKCLGENVVKHCSSKAALCEAIGMGPEDPLADLCAATWAGICAHNQQHDTCKNECGKLDGKRCGSANVLV